MSKSIWAALAATGIVLAASPAEASKGQVLWTFSAGYTYPAGLGFDGSSIWVSNLATATKGGTNAVHRHDPSTFAALSTFGMGSGRYYHGLAFGDGRIYTDNLYSNVVTLNTSGTQVAAFPAQGHAYGVAFDPATRHLYQVDMTTAILHTLDPATGASIASVPTTVTGQYGWHRMGRRQRVDCRCLIRLDLPR